MHYTPEQIGKLVRDARKTMGVTQGDLALASGTGQRFISDLEKGKATCQIGKVLTVLQTLGIEIELRLPIDLDAISGDGSGKGSGAGNSDGSGWG